MMSNRSRLKLIDRLLPDNDVAVCSRDEAKHWSIRNELAANPRLSQLKFYVGDIRDVKRVKDVIRQASPRTIIIAAALKQVDTCELSPSESVATNLLGTQNVITAVNDMDPMGLHSILFVSTDKACSPVNVYGMCKAISERIITSQCGTDSRRRWLAVRYGNVLESRGSIIPLFKHQVEHGECLTVTDPDMTRFIMTLDDSVTLILAALAGGASGETWVPKPPAMKIGDLAKIFSERFGKPIKVIGLRPGEKMHESLINESESSRTGPDDAKYYHVIGPAFTAGHGQAFTYTSADDVLTKDRLLGYLVQLGIMDRPLSEFKGLAIEEIMTNRKG